MRVHSTRINVRFLPIYVYECRQEKCQGLPSASLEQKKKSCAMYPYGCDTLKMNPNHAQSH